MHHLFQCMMNGDYICAPHNAIFSIGGAKFRKRAERKAGTGATCLLSGITALSVFRVFCDCQGSEEGSLNLHNGDNDLRAATASSSSTSTFLLTPPPPLLLPARGSSSHNLLIKALIFILAACRCHRHIFYPSARERGQPTSICAHRLPARFCRLLYVVADHDRLHVYGLYNNVV